MHSGPAGPALGAGVQLLYRAEHGPPAFAGLEPLGGGQRGSAIFVSFYVGDPALWGELVQGLAEALSPQSETLAAAGVWDPDRQSGGDGFYRSLVLVLFRAVFAHCPPGESLRELGGVPGLCGRGAVGAGGRSLFSRRASSGRAGGSAHSLLLLVCGEGQSDQPGGGGDGPGLLRGVGLVRLWAYAAVSPGSGQGETAYLAGLCLRGDAVPVRPAHGKDRAATRPGADCLGCGAGAERGRDVPEVPCAHRLRRDETTGGHGGDLFAVHRLQLRGSLGTNAFPRGPRRGRARAFGPGQGRGHRRPGRGPGQPAAPGDRGPGGGASRSTM